MIATCASLCLSRGVAIEVVDLDAQILLQLARLLQIALHVPVQPGWLLAASLSFVVISSVGRMTPQEQLPNTHAEGDLVEAQHEADAIPADVGEEAEHPVCRDEGERRFLRLADGRRQARRRRAASRG